MLALKGGTPLNQKSFKWSSSIGEQEKRAVCEVMDSKVLSGFLGSPSPRFLGGPKVQELDKKWAEYFSTKWAVSVNSATSGLYAAIGAIGISPGDEVIVPPLTMSASAVCILGYQGIPVFADCEPDYYCIDVDSVKKRITKRSKAVVVVDLFGQPANFDALKNLANKHNLILIEDSSQAPGAYYHDACAGTLADIGVFSLNCHKAIQSGEGGVVVTDNQDYAKRLQLIRNHAESVVESMPEVSLINMLGQNYRITELQAAIAICQLEKLRQISEKRQELAGFLTEKLSDFEFLRPPSVRPHATHVYYQYMIGYDPKPLGVSREKFVEALNAEGYSAKAGYVKPLYLLPVFQNKIVFGSGGSPYSLQEKGDEVNYSPGICPVAEKLHYEQLFYPDLIRFEITKEDIKVFADAIDKVARHSSELQ